QPVREALEGGVHQFRAERQRAGEHRERPPKGCGPHYGEQREPEPDAEALRAEAALRAPALAPAGDGPDHAAEEGLPLHRVRRSGGVSMAFRMDRATKTLPQSRPVSSSTTPRS